MLGVGGEISGGGAVGWAGASGCDGAGMGGASAGAVPGVAGVSGGGASGCGIGGSTGIEILLVSALNVRPPQRLRGPPPLL